MKLAQQTNITEQINTLFRPESIAVIGASENPESVGHALLSNLLEGNYQGEVYPVNPRYAGNSTGLAANQRCHDYVALADDLPDSRIALALIATPADTVPDILEKLGKKGVKVAVIISAGFSELGGAGKALSKELKAQAERSGMLLVGPNCLGIANMASDIRMNATFAQLSEQEGHGAIFSQSGAVGIDWLNRASQSGLSFRQFVSLGNSLMLQPEALLNAWRADPQIRYVLAYLESGASLAGLREAAAAFTQEKPLLLIKAGQSRAGAKAAQSHTGNLAGNEQAVQAFVEQFGVQRFDTMDELLAAAEAFESAPPIQGGRIAVLSNAGGYAVMATDWLTSEQAPDLSLAELNDETLNAMKALLPASASARNPLDTTATFPADQPEAFQRIFQAIASDPGVSACLLTLVDLMDLPVEQIIRQAAEIQDATGKPIVCMVSSTRFHVWELKQHCRDAGLPPVAVYDSLSNALIALHALHRHQTWQKRCQNQTKETELPPVLEWRQTTVRRILEQSRHENRTLLTTAESLDVLHAYDIPIAPYRLITSLQEVRAAAAALGYPLALKLNSKTITHKTEVGGVIVDIRTPEELRTGFDTMMAALEQAGTESFQSGEGIMVQSFMPKGRELILGVKTDPDFGKLMLIGRGGIYAAIDRDTRLRLNPLNVSDVRDMIQGIRAYRILKGYRGKPGIDFEALEQHMLRLSQFVEDFPEIQELDINPYMALPSVQGQSAAVDARIIICEADSKF